MGRTRTARRLRVWHEERVFFRVAIIFTSGIDCELNTQQSRARNQNSNEHSLPWGTSELHILSQGRMLVSSSLDIEAIMRSVN